MLKENLHYIAWSRYWNQFLLVDGYEGLNLMLKGLGISHVFTFDLKSGYHLVDILVYFDVKLLMGSCSNRKFYMFKMLLV